MHQAKLPTPSLCLLAVIAGCHGAGRTGAVHTAPPPLFEGLGSHQRTVTASSPQAQRYFDQGLIFAFAFNHDEAIRAFDEAARLDPNCAMAWWGVALCNGPHINNPAMDKAHAKAAWAAWQKADQLKEGADPAEQALITALGKRYTRRPPSDRQPLNRAYADAMREVWRSNPNDPDIGTLFAEALMDLQPWDLWTKEGEPKGGTSEILTVLEDVLRTAPEHPGANHLYIHAVEASPHAEKAIAAADALRTLVPAAGHLVHMPAHIDVRTGRWDLAAESNTRAIEADRQYRLVVPRQNFYRIYMAHNHHFLSYAAMMEGRSALAMQAAREMIAGIPPEYVKKEAALVDGYMSIALEALKRFGRWDDLLNEPKPPKHLRITTAMWHFSRGIAYAAKGDIDGALREQELLDKAIKRVPQDAVLSINPAHKVLPIAQLVLAAEIKFRRGQIDAAVTDLREAAHLEDDLQYMEPPEWMQPVRHTLGAVLVSAGRHAAAEGVYRDDLVRWPENGWSLYGLTTCLKARDATVEARDVEARFAKAWARADVQIGASCLCVPPSAAASQAGAGQTSSAR